MIIFWLSVRQIYDRLVILGDFNPNFSQVSSPQTKFLFSFMKQFQLHELVQSPTRVTATTTSHLDLILTNIPSFFFQNTVAIPFCGSDHHIVLTYTSVLEVLASHPRAGLFILDDIVSWIQICLKRYCSMIPGMTLMM